MKVVWKATLYVVAALVITGFAYQSYFSYLDRDRFPPNGTMVDVGGYKLHANIVGRGDISVVLEAGMGDSGLVWNDVISQVDTSVTIVSYDRGGLGWSDSSPLPRTSKNIVLELQRLLENAGVEGPYLLVGHSFGGLTMQLFAKMHSDQVVGLVLVDSAHQDQRDRLPPSSPVRRAIFVAGMRAAPIGIPRLYMSKKGSAEHAVTSTTKHQYAYLDESNGFEKSTAALIEYSESLGVLPMTIIARNDSSNSLSLKGASQRTIQWALLQEELSRQSSNSRLIFTGQTGHAIHRRQPDIVADAINSMIKTVRAESTRSSVDNE